MEHFNRKLSESVLKGLQNKRLVFIIGPRRVGKTTLMKMIIDRFEAKKTIFIDIETLSEYSMFESYQNFIRYLETNGIKTENKALITIDEVQHIEGINSILKSVIDHQKKWYILCSGSSSLGILKHVKESLAGRKRVVELKPLYFEEFLTFSKNVKLLNKLKNVSNQVEWNWIKEESLYIWEEYIIYGGMPEVVLQKEKDEKIQELKDISKSYILLDVYSYLRGEVEIIRFNKMIKFIANNSGKLMKLSEISRKSGIKRHRVEESVFLFDSAGIINLLPPFFTNKNKEITKEKKSVFYDTGIRNAIIEDFQNLNKRLDKGFITEIAIANNLRDCDLFYYRTKHQTEIDFVIKKDGELIPIEVKSGNLRVIPRALKFFMERYNLERGYVITKDLWQEKEFEGRIVHFIPAPLFTINLPL